MCYLLENLICINSKKRNSIKDQSSAFYLTSVLGLAFGLVISFPPFLADSAWRSSLKSGSIENVQKVANQWPLDSYRLANISIALVQNKLDAQGLEIARKGIAFNPNYFDSWKAKQYFATSTWHHDAAMDQSKCIYGRLSHCVNF